MATGDLPQLSESQRIGKLAEKCFSANIPNAWLHKDLGGTDDFGFDYLIQTVCGTQVTDTFKVQLKGTENPSVSADRKIYSIELKASTVRYYAGATEPILLVLADLSTSTSAKNCSLFYCWIHDELKRINFSELADEQKRVTLHVPKASALTEETDLSADLAHLKKIAQVANALDVAIEQIYPEETALFRVGVLQKIPNALARRGPSLIEALIADQASHWINPPEGSMAWRLTEIDQRLKIGDSNGAAQLLAAAEPFLSCAEKAEVPEYWHLRGRILSLSGDESASLESFAVAVEFGNGKAKYLAAWAETYLRTHFDVEKPSDYSTVLAKLSGDDPVIVETRTRALAAEGKYDEAMALAATLANPERAICQAIIQSMQGESENVLAICAEGLASPDLKAGRSQLFLVLKARARFRLALVDSGVDLATTVIPPDGLPGTDIDLLNLAWDDINEAVTALHTAGWPSNVEFISDIWPAVAGMLGKQEEILPLLAKAGAARPHIVGLQLAIESIGAQSSEFAIALDANARQPVNDLSLCRRVALLHGAKKDSECLIAFEAIIDHVDRAHPMFLEAVSCAILSADRIVRSDLVSAWRELFDTSPAQVCALAIVDFFLVKVNNPLGTGIAQDALENVYEAHGHPFQIATQLFQLMDPTNPSQAKRTIEIGKVLQAHRMLDMDGTLKMAQAFSTMGEWNALLDISTGALRRFKGSDRLAATEALALDRLGRTVEARAVLERLINSGANDRLALNIYINIAGRTGMIEEALTTVESVLSASTTPKQKIECLRLLYNLRHIADPTDPRTLDLVWRIGQLGDRGDEVEEGIFLSMLLAATSIVERPLEPAQGKEFGSRLQVFFDRFPNSDVLRKTEARDDASEKEIWSSMSSLAKRDSKGRDAQIKIENQIRVGSLRVPFAWRPRNALRYVPDLPYLWELSKCAKHGDLRHLLTMTRPDWRPIRVEAIRDRAPLLDLLSLLVAKDLDILPNIFQLFPKIAVGQGTLVEIARLTAPMSGSPFREKCLQLQAELKSRFEQIIQPFVQFPDKESGRSGRWPLKEIQALARKEEFLLYSDDSIFRSMCAAEAGLAEGICTMDVLCALEQGGQLTTAEVAHKIAQLASWKVALAIDTKYQRAILPPALRTARSVEAGIELIRGDEACMAVMNAVWDGEPDYVILQQRAGSLLRDLVGDENTSTAEISAVMGIWYFKAKLREGAPFPSTALLSFLTFQAAGSGPALDASSSKRLWRVFGALVELSHGAEMDEKKERDSIAMLGEVGAQIDFSSQHSAQRAKEWLNLELTEGTSDHDCFHRGYEQELVRLVAEKALQ